MKTVCVTPAGRKKYMEVLAPRLLADPDVDRWDLWVNTRNPEDLRYMEELAGSPKVRLVRVDAEYNHYIPLAYRIHNFYRHATDTDTVYVRLDDDIVWYSPHAVGNLAEIRTGYPKPFLVYGNVLNSGLTSYRHQQWGRIPREWGTLTQNCMCDVSWKDGGFAVKLHEKFLSDPDQHLWELSSTELTNYERHSINVVSWLGSDCAKWCDEVDTDEELWMCVTAPTQYERPCLVLGTDLFVHFAFHTQRDDMDASGLINRYRSLP